MSSTTVYMLPEGGDRGVELPLSHSALKHPHVSWIKWLLWLVAALMALGAFIATVILIVGEKRAGTLILSKANTLVENEEALIAVLLTMNANLEAVMNMTAQLYAK